MNVVGQVQENPDYFAAGMEHVARPVLGLFVIRRRSGICFILLAILDINDAENFEHSVERKGKLHSRYSKYRETTTW